MIDSICLLFRLHKTERMIPLEVLAGRLASSRMRLEIGLFYGGHLEVCPGWKVLLTLFTTQMKSISVTMYLLSALEGGRRLKRSLFSQPHRRRSALPHDG